MITLHFRKESEKESEYEKMNPIKNMKKPFQYLKTEQQVKDTNTKRTKYKEKYKKYKIYKYGYVYKMCYRVYIR